ncbi:hypothetical protein ABT352_23240 [Streptosporangium sp. NPDC000563]|uniref:hypothetical protein n=1 Tax=Streptosporangium sp. NPDC000563 TaxID=3154366 RepID=UPI0033195A33
MGEWRPAVFGPPQSFVLDAEVYELAGSWQVLLEWLPAERWHMHVLYGLLHPLDADRLSDRLDDGEDPLTREEVRAVAERLVQQATGHKWWVAQRLYATLAASWAELDGQLSLRGVELAALLPAPARACNLVYAWLVDGADEQGRRRLDMQLTRPPAGMTKRQAAGAWSPQEQGRAFMDAYRAQGDAGGRSPARVA